ncbi:MAG: hypothetical protein R3191_01440 [Anaerolineales bacterium]|nr:hypothetical protein [Anaerolineales bacterium]
MTNAESNRPGSDQLQATMDLNLLPERYRRQLPDASTILSWALMIVLLGALYFSYETFQAANLRYQEQRAALRSAREDMEGTTPFEQRVDELREQIQAEQNRAQALRSAGQSLAVQQIAWGATLTSFMDAAPAGLRITNIAQNPTSVDLAGVAQDYHLPLQYAAELRNMGADVDVEVQAIHVQIPPTPTEVAATPSPTPTDGDGPEGESVSETVYTFTITVAYPEVQPPSEILASGGEQ